MSPAKLRYADASTKKRKARTTILEDSETDGTLTNDLAASTRSMKDKEDDQTILLTPQKSSQVLKNPQPTTEGIIFLML